MLLWEIHTPGSLLLLRCISHAMRGRKRRKKILVPSPLPLPSLRLPPERVHLGELAQVSHRPFHPEVLFPSLPRLFVAPKLCHTRAAVDSLHLCRRRRYPCVPQRLGKLPDSRKDILAKMTSGQRSMSRLDCPSFFRKILRLPVLNLPIHPVALEQHCLLDCRVLFPVISGRHKVRPVWLVDPVGQALLHVRPSRLARAKRRTRHVPALLSRNQCPVQDAPKLRFDRLKALNSTNRIAQRGSQKRCLVDSPFTLAYHHVRRSQLRSLHPHNFDNRGVGERPGSLAAPAALEASLRASRRRFLLN
mmetsp:Transcript_8951/g.33764  ORF Transcript_8951/g.33764 Transcript_8951/m.33764 type:complete len:304 (+) Transcript_8951:89-1000(+)